MLAFASRYVRRKVVDQQAGTKHMGDKKQLMSRHLIEMMGLMYKDVNLKRLFAAPCLFPSGWPLRDLRIFPSWYHKDPIA